MKDLSRTVRVTSLGEATSWRDLDIAEEVPVRLVFGGVVSYGIMMMTPDALEDFAVGYCLTEGIVDALSEIRAIKVTAGEDGPTLNITITGERFSALLRRRPRAQTGHSSCGLCGSDTVLAVDIAGSVRFTVGTRVRPEAIRRAIHDLERWQTLNARTRMVHGAAWANIDGDILMIREDIGRHNALDKLIGARLRSTAVLQEGMCLLTSRYSYEMALKTARAGMHTVVAISAPTGRALRLAEAINQTLVAIARRDRQTVFCGHARLGENDQ